MGRTSWKATYRAARIARRRVWEARRSLPETAAFAWLDHAGIAFSLRLSPHIGDPFRDGAFRLVPSFITDQSPRQRKAEALAWAARYRNDAARLIRYRAPSFEAEAAKASARACLWDAQEIQPSAFHRLP